MKNEKNENTYDYAHFNPKELEILDETQGGRTNYPKTPLRHFEKLEHIMSDPKIEKLLMKQYEHHAKGGRIGDMLREADSLRQKGRKGDIDIAVIGPNTRRIFNKLMNGGSVNPESGKSEYFNLGGMMKGIGRTVSHGVSSLGHMATKALPGAIMGGMEGGPEGALAGGLGSLAMGQMSGGGRKAPQIPQNLGQMGQQFMGSQMGQNMQSRGQNMYNNANQHYQKTVNSPMGRGAMGAMNGYYGTNNKLPSNLGGAARNFMNNSPEGQSAQQYGRNSYNNANQQYQGALNSPMGQSFQNGYNNGGQQQQQQPQQQQQQQGGYNQGYDQGYDNEDY
jgi:hypothetical protein